MTKKCVLGMPGNMFYMICSILSIGIIIGSIFDYQISVALSNTTAIGDFHQHYGNIISHLLYPVAGMCLFKGLRKKGSIFNTLAWGVLGFSLFWTFYSFLDTSGKYLRAAYGYVPGQPGSLLPLALSYMTWMALACLTAYLAYLILDDENADMLLAVGSVILLAGIFSELINTGLKIVGCRPRYKYLLTLDDPASEYRNWWVLGYNRIHMNAHFLTDVCFGVLITYCLYALTYKLVFSIFEKGRQNK